MKHALEADHVASVATLLEADGRGAGVVGLAVGARLLASVAGVPLP